MNFENTVNVGVVVISTIMIIICSIGVVIAVKFQRKQKKKYNECIKIIKEKGIQTLQFKNGLTEDEIKNINENINLNDLMRELYETYIIFQNKIRLFDNNLDNVLTGFIKEFYADKINTSKKSCNVEITDGIDLIGYTITEFDNNKLKFKITINCFNYKKANDVIVSGSNLEKVEQVIILTYKKVNDKWLISNYEKVYQKKLSV